MTTVRYNDKTYEYPPIEFPLDPEATRAHVLRLHESTMPIDNDELDTVLFGLPNVAVSQAVLEANSEADIRARYQGEALWLTPSSGIWTPYNKIRSIVKVLDLGEDSVLYDLGAGFNRLGVYAGIVTTAQCRGIEIMPERTALTKATIDRLELTNVTAIEANVKDVDYSDGTDFFMYSPFSYDTMQHVMDQLVEVARDHPIRITTGHHMGSPLEKYWLEHTTLIKTAGLSDSLVYQSVDP